MSAAQPVVWEKKRVDLRVDAVEVGGTFSGYASLFGKVDLARDMVERGAFARSLAARKAAGVRMLFQHDPGEPIGTWLELREDGRGLFVRGRLAAEVARSREVLNLMRDGALDGLSIGFRTVKARRDAGSGIRRIVEADLWEISVVTFPMLPGARVETVKRAGGGELPTLREFERRLVRDAGLTRGDARTVVARGYAALVGERDAAGTGTQALAERIRKATRMIDTKTE